MAHKYTEEQKKFIKEKANGIGNMELTSLVNSKFSLQLTVQQIKGYKNNHKISSGLTGRFEKGIIPFNKGKKMPTVGRMAETQFKKGQQPANYKPVGSERIDSKDGYILVKVRDDGTWPERWRLKHRVLWESVHGPIPKGHRLIFLDGNKLKVTIENLKLVTFAQSAVMCKKGMFSSDPKLTETGSVLAEVIIKTNQVARGAK